MQEHVAHAVGNRVYGAQRILAGRVGVGRPQDASCCVNKNQLTHCGVSDLLQQTPVFLGIDMDKETSVAGSNITSTYISCSMFPRPSQITSNDSIQE